MCKDIEKELERGDKDFKNVAIHLFNMGAASTSQDITIPPTGDTFKVSVERIPKDKTKCCASRPCIHCQRPSDD
jgi:hypothetical protein